MLGLEYKLCYLNCALECEGVRGEMSSQAPSWLGYNGLLGWVTSTSSMSLRFCR